MKHWKWFAACAALIAACAGSQPPARVIEQYVQARVAGDVNTMIGLSCPAWEPQARLEADSIRSRAPRLDALSCSEAGTDGNTTLVACTGKIVTNYAGESREFSLAERQFKLVDSRMCGYK